MAKENGVQIHNGISYSAINKNEIILVGKKDENYYKKLSHGQKDNFL